jgi:hypothetical protein
MGEAALHQLDTVRHPRHGDRHPIPVLEPTRLVDTGHRQVGTALRRVQVMAHHRDRLGTAHHREPPGTAHLRVTVHHQVRLGTAHHREPPGTAHHREPPGMAHLKGKAVNLMARRSLGMGPAATRSRAAR